MKLLGKSIADTGGAVICIAALLSSGGVAANAEELWSDPLAAVVRVAPESMSNAADVHPVAASPEALDATVNGTNVVVPSDPTESLRLSSGNGDASLGLPFAGEADDAVLRGEGAVSYDNNNGSSTVPIVRRDGSVQINTVIHHSNAPKRYDYPVSVPSGQSLHLAPDGSVYIAAATSVPSFYIAAPWAKDAVGEAVPTHFEVNGTTLTQVVDFTPETAFPVVADPTVFSTGQASYNCVLTNGSSYFMTPGAPLTSCKGSYLQKYYNGGMAKSVALVFNGKYNVKPTGAGWCILALASAATLAWNPVSATGLWVASTALTLGGASGSCYQI